MGAFSGKEGSASEAKAQVSFKEEVPPVLQRDGSYYASDIDGYSKLRVVRPGDVKTAKLDHDLFKAMLDCIKDDGVINKEEVRTVILPKVADGRGNKSELTCNERWTIRYALGEFQWDFEARILLLNSMHAMEVLNTADEKVEGEASKEITFGPSLEALQGPPAKKAAGSERLIYVDGMNLDRDMLLAAAEATGDGVIDAIEAIKIFQSAADSANVLTRCERWTARFILSSHVFTDAAFNFLKEALQKLERNDQADAD